MDLDQGAVGLTEIRLFKYLLKTATYLKKDRKVKIHVIEARFGLCNSRTHRSARNCKRLEILLLEYFKNLDKVSATNGL